MKTFKLIGLIVALMFLMGCVTVPVQPDTATIPDTLGNKLIVYDEWDGPINPYDFKDWEILGYQPCPKGYIDYHILLKNPAGNPDAIEIGVVPHENKKQVILVWYRYKADKVLYVFSVTVTNKTKYSQVKPKGA